MQPARGAAATAIAGAALVLGVAVGFGGAAPAAAAPPQASPTSTVVEPVPPTIDVDPVRRPAQLVVVGTGPATLMLLDDAGETVGVVPADPADPQVEVDLCRDGRHLVETAPDEVRVRDLASLVVTTRFDRLPLSGAYRCVDAAGTQLATAGPQAVFAVGPSTASVDVGATIMDVLGVTAGGGVLVETADAIVAVDLAAGTATTRWTLDPTVVVATDRTIPATADRELSPDGRLLLVSTSAAVPGETGSDETGAWVSSLSVLDADTGAVTATSGDDAVSALPAAQVGAGTASWIDAQRIGELRPAGDLAVLDAADLATVAVVSGVAAPAVGTPALPATIVALIGPDLVWLPLGDDDPTIAATVPGAVEVLALPAPLEVTADLSELAQQVPPPTPRPFGQDGRGARFGIDLDEPPVAAVPGLALTAIGISSLVIASSVVRHVARDRRRARIAEGATTR